MPNDEANPSELSQTIIDNAQSAKKAKGDNGELEQHSLTEQIEADRYLSNRKAARRGVHALQITKVIPPGSA